MSNCLMIVEVKYPELSEAIQKIAFSNGFNWKYVGDYTIKHIEQPYLVFYNDKKIHWDDNKTWVERQNYPFCIFPKDFNEAVELLSNHATLNYQLGKLSPNGKTLVVDCQTIGFAEVETIYHRMVDLQKGEK